MQVWSSLPEEIGDLSGVSSPSSVALCRAILEDAQTAREFALEPHGGMEMLRVVMLGSQNLPTAGGSRPSELTSLFY